MRTLKFVVAFLVVLSVSGIAFAQPPQSGGTIIASGFNGPQGILVDPEGNVWVVDSGLGGDQPIQVTNPQTGELTETRMGDTSRIVKVAPDGTQTEVAVLPSIMANEMEMSGGSRLALLDGTLYATSGGWSGSADTTPAALMAAVVSVGGDGPVTAVADLWSFEKANNPGGFVLDTHPYGLAAGPDGWLWVADAGANALLKVNPASGEVQLVAVFDALPGAFENPARGGAVEADPVPTGVAFDDAGNAYVSLLSGAPFIPGSAKVLKVDAYGAVSDYATGLTTLTDIRRGPDGAFYAVSFGIFTQDGPTPNSGSVLRIQEGGASEVIVSGLSFPTSLDFDGDGNAYVTENGVGAPGSGAVARFDKLTEMAGTPLPAAQ